MSKSSGGHLVAKALKAEGVGAIFTLCGGHIIDIYDGCVDEGIHIVDVRHEQTAAHAADAWTRMTGVAGVAVVTAGPGTTDTVTGVANAFRAQSPMLLIGGQAARTQLLTGGLQELDHVSLLRPITKFAATVLDTARIPELISMAFREAYNGRPGPAFLEIPRDVLDAEVDAETVRFPRNYRSRGRIQADQKLLQQAADWLSAAQRPAVLAGSQIWHCRAVEALSQFALRAQVPVYLNGAARGSLPVDAPTYFNRSRRHALSQADVVLVIGTPFDFRLGYGKRLAPMPRSFRSISITANSGTIATSTSASWPTHARCSKHWPPPSSRADTVGRGSTSCARSSPSDTRRTGRSCTPTRCPSTRCGWRARSTSFSATIRFSSATAATWSRSRRAPSIRAGRATGWTRGRWERSA